MATRLMQFLFGLVALVFVGCCPLRGVVDDGAEDPSSAQWIADRAWLTPGSRAELGFVAQVRPGWHTYGDPPGDSGMPPQISWQLPPGVSVGSLRLPPAHSFREEAGTTFGYENEVMMVVSVTLDNSVSSEIVEIGATLDYLVCGSECVPQRAELALQLPVRRKPATVMKAWRSALQRGGWGTPGEHSSGASENRGEFK